jgi:glycosyltransferase involved in cell wall biosynthesis
VLLLTRIPAPYRFESFDELARRPDIHLTVAFVYKSDPRWPWNVAERDISFASAYLEDYGGAALGTLRLIKQHRPHVLISGGWDHLAYGVAVLAQPFGGYRLVQWLESTTKDARRRSKVRTWIKRRVMAWSAAAVVPGRAAAEYATSLGAREIVVAPNALDNRLFARHRNGDTGDGASPPPPSAARVIYVGRLSHEKGVDVLVSAWRQVERESNAELVIIGSGPEEAALRELSGTLGLKRVRWVPFVQAEELPAWYHSADLLVLPSRSEVWGFVLNEAMSAGVPAVVTDVVGASGDLLIDGVNGWVVPTENPQAMAERISSVLINRELLKAAGAVATDSVAAFTPQAWADAVAALVRSLVPNGVPAK